MAYVVFWLEGGQSSFKKFSDLELTESLAFAHVKRHDPLASHVTLSSENPDRVGKSGVDSIKDGKTPDGEVYDWKKRRW